MFLFNTRTFKGPKPADFYGCSKEVSLNELIEVANKSNFSLYLPCELPNSLELITTYLKETPFIAIVVYSAEGNKDYKTAELAIEIAPSPCSPTYEELVAQTENSEYETALMINGWPVLVNEHASAGGNEEFRQKYGAYSLLVMTWIDGMQYLISCPTLSPEEAIQLIENMILIT